ncbi:hypothetical protein TPHA_0G02630 [Tetrapisispora phaffii CBS 4417]|uniref:DNA repair metallo-beta-lactamase domain-containing protein n=1 Tax=Tetrapisispora phaffii (strain ATCC 24235 / CBS 4417 / NBRC 1672 / NRRL Y-8282 / UCD 70-5) TaxID=1071381 RepID=G8BW22_TETPH|nr:hypothetical protein TPHA_0G02630 [Tetrapisispora phaffii CBS 4417]CCE64100.1 hypothetical protein TPHA_0G02630 [Tetrapisispora phaffii CBS 4417]
MANKSIIQIKRSEVKLKSSTKLKRTAKLDGISKRSNASQTLKSNKKQRSLLEFNIPTTKIMPIGHRGPSEFSVKVNKVINLNDDNSNENNPKYNGNSINKIYTVDDVVEILSDDDDKLNDSNIGTGYIAADKIQVNEIEQTIYKSIICPICELCLDDLKIHEREVHCEECIEGSLKKESETSIKLCHEESLATIIDLEGEIQQSNNTDKEITTNRKEEILINQDQGNKKEIVIAEQKNVTVKENKKVIVQRKSKPKAPLPKFKILTFDGGSYKIVVDGFNYASEPDINKYFLSHFHSDHYIGLKKSWDQGIIYCTEVTAKLMELKFNLTGDMVQILPLNEHFWIEPYLSVIAIDANHCPGAAIFLFQEWDKAKLDTLPSLRQILHTGDFRSNKSMIENINRIVNGISIDEIYLDTTYLTPGYHFPLQKSVLDTTSNFACKLENDGKQLLFKDTQRSIMSFLKNKNKCKFNNLFLIGTYSIGKEKLAISIAKKLNTKIFINKDSLKFKIISQYLNCFPADIITNDVSESYVHLVPISVLNSKETIENYITTLSESYENIVGFIPTGWTFMNRYGIKLDQYETIAEKVKHCQELLDEKNALKYDTFNIDSILKQYKKYAKYQIFKVPYSEHSSFKDLIEFGININCDKFIAIVNLDDMNKVDNMISWFKAWEFIKNAKGNGV